MHANGLAWMMRAVKVHGGRRRVEPQRHRSAVMRALIPGDAHAAALPARGRRIDGVRGRRLGLPVRRARSHGAGEEAPEKKDLKIGFIAITCASPLIMADPLGFYREQGLNVQLMKTGLGA